MKKDLSKLFSEKRSFRTPILDRVTALATAGLVAVSIGFSAGWYHYTTLDRRNWTGGSQPTEVPAWQQLTAAMAQLEQAQETPPELPPRQELTVLSARVESSREKLEVSVMRTVTAWGFQTESPAVGMPVSAVLECVSLKDEDTKNPPIAVGAQNTYEVDPETALLTVNPLPAGEYLLSLTLPETLLESEAEDGTRRVCLLPQPLAVTVQEKIVYKVVEVEAEVGGDGDDDPDAGRGERPAGKPQEEIPEVPQQPDPPPPASSQPESPSSESTPQQPSAPPESGSQPGSSEVPQSPSEPGSTPPESGSTPPESSTSNPGSGGNVFAHVTGWQRYKGNTYYIDEDHNPVTGMTKIDGTIYCFNAGGELFINCIDVSRHNGAIDWKKVAAGGVKYAVIRVGYRGWGDEGNLKIDSQALENLKNAKAAGLKIGVYFFSTAITEEEAVEEASLAVKVVKEAGVRLDLPIYCDSEWSNTAGNGRSDDLSKISRTEIVRAFCETVKSAGYKPGLYCSSSWLQYQLDASQVSGYALWIANWKSPDALPGCQMQQYCADGNDSENYNTVPGVPTLVDVNYYYPSGDMEKGTKPGGEAIRPPAPESGSESESESGSEPESEPEDEPGGEPGSEPESEPGSEPESEPGSEPGSEPEEEPGSEPESEPEDEPEDEPESEPESEPGSEPESEPESQAGSEPESEPESQADSEPESLPETVNPT